MLIVVVMLPFLLQLLCDYNTIRLLEACLNKSQGLLAPSVLIFLVICEKSETAGRYIISVCLIAKEGNSQKLIRFSTVTVYPTSCWCHSLPYSPCIFACSISFTLVLFKNLWLHQGFRKQNEDGERKGKAELNPTINLLHSEKQKNNTLVLKHLVQILEFPALHVRSI